MSTSVLKSIRASRSRISSFRNTSSGGASLTMRPVKIMACVGSRLGVLWDFKFLLISGIFLSFLCAGDIHLQAIYLNQLEWGIFK